MLSAQSYGHLIDKLRGRRRAYQLVFCNQDRKTINPAADIVMQDLNEFCMASKTQWHADSHVRARLEGRREVFQRIMEHLHMSSEQLFQRYGGVNIGVSDD